MSRDNRHSSAGRDRPVLLSRVASLLLLASLLGGCSLLSGDETAPAAEVTVRAEPGAPGEAQAAETSGEVAGAQAEAAAPTGGGEAADSGQAPEQSGNALIPAAAEGPAAEELGRVSIVYPPDNADLPETVTAELDKLAEQLSQNGAVRVELHAYAGGDEDQASKAKLYSLKRGMKVRSYLYQAGVEAPRILLRPLGLETSEEPADRVDIILLRDEEAVPQTRVAGASQFVPATGEALTQGFALADSGEAEAAPQAQPVAPVAERPLGALEALGVVRSGPAEIQAAAAPPTEAPATASPEQGPGPDASVVPSAVAGPLPQGDAGLAAEDSLTARFEALAATDVQLAATPEQQATIARRGGTLVSTDGDGNVSTSETQLAEALSEVPSGGEAAFASHFTPQSAAPELATPEPGALPPAGPGETAAAAAQPRFVTGPAMPSAPSAEGTPEPTSPGSAVSIAEGAAFEAALAGAGAEPQAVPQAATSLPGESAAARAPALAALPPPDSPTGTAAPPDVASRDHFLVHFELDSPDMTSTGRGSLQEAIDQVLSRPNTRVRIVAHAEGQQSDEFLLGLSAIRRNEVENALRNAGVPFGRIWSKAVGDRKPLVAGAGGAASADNNVVEIVISQRG